MSKLLLPVMLLLGTACAVRAQDFPPRSSPTPFLQPAENGERSIFLSGMSPEAPPRAALFLASEPASATPARRAPPQVLADVGRSRLEIGFGYEYVRFRSSPIDRNLNGVHTTATWYLDDSFGIEGSVVAAFGTTIFGNEHPKYLLYTAGPRVVLGRHRWRPWGHALIGGLHMLPQIGGGFGQNSFAAQLGGGVDYMIAGHLALRLQGDYVRSQLYGTGQNNFQLGTGIAFRF